VFHLTGSISLQAKNDELMMKLAEMEELNKKYQDDVRISENLISDLKTEMGKLSFSEDTFRGNDARTRYMTGLPCHEVLFTMFEQVEPFIKHNYKYVLSKFQQFILTLMRLRLNVEFVFLGYIFGVSQRTASKVFHGVIDVRYQPLVLWPERKHLQESMPVQFREQFGKKVAVIIDCFEVFMDRPSNPLASAQVFSNYKRHTTVKWLIGISPQGSIVFISRGYGGRASDQGASTPVY